MTKIYTGSVGVQFVLDTGQDLTGATVMKIYAKKPDGTTVTWDASQYGTTQSITYTTDSDDLNLAGYWILQSYVEWGTTKIYGESVKVGIFSPYE